MSLSDKLSHTQTLMNCIHWFQQTISKPVAKSHHGVAIDYLDIEEKRSLFIKELKSTAIHWVYSSEKFKEIFAKEMTERGNDALNVIGAINEIVNMKFRKGHPKGQYGELLLFNFIQHFFNAVPLLRKMSITTNPNLERNGADAIHYKIEDGKQVFILGESKCYASNYKFNAALSDAVDSIITSMKNIQSELEIYRYEDFIDPDLQKIADDLIKGRLDNPFFELVCLVVYEENTSVDAPTAKEIKDKIEECIVGRWEKTQDDLYKNVKEAYTLRLNYIVFPTWALDNLLELFEK